MYSSLLPMKKIRFDTMTWTKAGLLKSSFSKQLTEQHADIKEMSGQIIIKEAWQLTEGRTKIVGAVRLNDGSYFNFSRVVELTDKAD
ncbi:MAG: hypothetical protein WCB68_01845 [Pyrinomonadaceae bacterium]